MAVCQILPGIIILVVFLGGVFFIKPWEAPPNKIIRVVRSAGVGILTEVFVLSGFMVVGLTEVNDNCLGSIRVLGLDYLAFFVLPISIGAALGFYFGYRQFSWLISIRKKIGRRK